MEFAEILDVINKSESFIITSHIMPDGDSVGSLLAMTLFLEGLGKNVIPMVRDPIPKRYLFLPGSEDIQKACDEFSDVVICLDSGDEERLGLDQPVRKYGSRVINIDHHKTNDMFGDINYVDSKASSTGEILYDLISVRSGIDLNIALCLYTAIVTDTGSIRYSNTSPKTLKILSHLLEIGVKPDLVSRNVFENKSPEAISLLKAFLDTIEFHANGAIALSHLTQKMIDSAGAQEDDCDGLINWPRQIRGVEIAAFLRQIEDKVIKVGLRSNGKMDVSKIAKAYQGGGHAKAAGFTLNTTLDRAELLVARTLQEYLERDAIGRNN